MSKAKSEAKVGESVWLFLTEKDVRRALVLRVEKKGQLSLVSISTGPGTDGRVDIHHYIPYKCNTKELPHWHEA